MPRTSASPGPSRILYPPAGEDQTRRTNGTSRPRRRTAMPSRRRSPANVRGQVGTCRLVGSQQTGGPKVPLGGGSARSGPARCPPHSRRGALAACAQRALKRAVVRIRGGIPPQIGHEGGLLHVRVHANVVRVGARSARRAIATGGAVPGCRANPADGDLTTGSGPGPRPRPHLAHGSAVPITRTSISPRTGPGTWAQRAAHDP
jgi:hypothetical protein